MTTTLTFQWLRAILATIGALTAVAVAYLIVYRSISRILPFLPADSLLGFTAGLTVVLSTYLFSPAFRLPMTLIASVIGVLAGGSIFDPRASHEMCGEGACPSKIYEFISVIAGVATGALAATFHAYCRKAID